MTRRDEQAILEQLLAVGDGAPPLQEKLRHVEHLSRRSPEHLPILANMLLERAERAYQSLMEARFNIERLGQTLENLTRTPWRVARFVSLVSTSCGEFALIRQGGAESLVTVSDEVDAVSLVRGDEVYVTGDLTAIVARPLHDSLRGGETAIFDRHLSSGRAAIKYRDEELVADIVGPLRDHELKAGDLVLWDRASGAICEKLESGGASEYLLEDAPDTPKSRVGGLSRCLEELLPALTLSLVAPEMAIKYGLNGRVSILMCGAPGVGKTLMAQVAATEVEHLAGKKCKLAIVKPGQWESKWVGQTEENIRSFFRTCREAARDNFVVVFLDEIEAVGRIRGGVTGQHSDRSLAAFLAELDGFVNRGRVAIICATNRMDLIDPALLERLSDIVIHVPRPDVRGARAIFGIHLPESCPYGSNGMSSVDARDEIIESLVSQFYSPNGENSVCTLRFRDGRVRTVAARELASGRTFEQICRAARRSAAVREHFTGKAGICLRDAEDGLQEAIKRLASTLTTSNVRSYLEDLPQDVDVVAVEPVAGKVSNEHHYIRVA